MNLRQMQSSNTVAVHFIVVPCYNEQFRLDLPSFSKSLLQHTDIHLLFVDDGSRDDTFGILTEFAQKNIGRVSVLKQERNQGKGEAVRSGMMYAHDHLLTDPLNQTLGYLDADLATSVDEYLGLSHAILSSSAVCVLGSRVPRLGARILRERKRMILGRVFAGLVGMILKISVYDTQCGAKSFKPAVVPDLFAEKFPQKWIFDVEILRRACMQGLSAKLLEIPLWEWRDVAGSKLRASHFVTAFVELFFIWTKTRGMKVSASEVSYDEKVVTAETPGTKQASRAV